MQKRYRVTLTDGERDRLESMLNRGRVPARRLTRARILLHADEGERGSGWADGASAEAVRCGRRTVERTRQRFVEEGLEAALDPRPTSRVSAMAAAAILWFAMPARNSEHGTRIEFKPRQSGGCG